MKLKSRLLITLILLILVVGFGAMFFREGTLAVDKSDATPRIFVINRGDRTQEIISKLRNEGLIRNSVVFFAVVKMQGIESNLQAGVFRLSPSMDAYRVASELTHGSLDISVTLIEGQRKEEMATILSQNIGLPESEFIKEAREGYLFPDTYFIPKNADVETVIKILTTNFNSKFKQAKQEVRKQSNLSDDEIIVLASLIEREARFESDRPQIANILLKRIDEGHKLQVDATVQYVLGYQPKEKRWWKKALSFDDLEVDSAYNTYRKFGLPPTSICNPGIASIKAALSASGNTPYLFYISDKTGKMHYARNVDEHQTNIDKYLK